jgi:PAS domain S-box-containing protein
MISAIIGVTSLCLGGVEPWAAYGRLLWVWWLGDATGALVMAPVLLTWAARGPHLWRAGRLVEAVALVVSLVIVTMAVFSGLFVKDGTTHPLAYFIFPFVIWAALRFGQVGTTTVTFIASGIAIWETVNGHGPFAKGNVNESLILLQLFMAVVAVTGLLLGAAIAETRRAERRAAAQYATARILAESKTLEDALGRLLEAVCRCLDWDVGALWTADPGQAELRLARLWHVASRQAPVFEAESRGRRFPPGIGLPGRVWATAAPLWLADVMDDANFPRVTAAAREGLRGAFGVPIIFGGQARGVMEFFSREVRPPDDELLETMAALGHQVGQFIERTRAEEERLAGEARKAAILEVALDCIITIDQDGRVIEWNPAAERTFGFSRDEAIGRPMAQLIVPPHLRGHHYRGMAHYLETGEGPVLGKRIEFTGMRKDGSEFPVELSISVVRGRDRSDFTAYLRDITEQKRAAQELERSEERYRTFIHQSSEGIWRFEASEPIVLDRPEDELIADFYRCVSLAECNDAFARMYGYESAEEIVGLRLDDFLPRSDPHNIEYLRAFIASGFRLNEAESHEIDRDGRRKYFLNNLLGIVRDGRLVRAWGTQRDITEQKRVEEHRLLMAEAGRILGSSLDYEATLSSVCKLVVPVLADWCTLDLVSDDGGLRRLQVAHRDPDKVRFAEELRRRYPPNPDEERGLMNVLRTGEPEHYPEITDEMLVEGARDAEHLEILRAMGLESAVIVPLKVSGRTIGVLSLATAESGRRYDEDELRFAMELASRAALAVDNARLFGRTGEAVRVRDEALSLHRGMEEKLTLLVQASGSLSESLELESVLNAVLTLSRRLISADAYAVWRYRSMSGRWGIELASGLSDEYQRSSIEVMEETPSMTETPVVAEDVHESPLLGRRAEAYDHEGIRSLMSVPLRVHGSISGTLVFYYRSPHRFSETDVRVATALSNLAGSAIGTAELYQELRDNDRRKDEFLAMLAHELRNPLSAISNAVRLSRRTQVEEDLEWSKVVIERQANKLARLMDDLLDVSRITRGMIQLNREILDVRPILQSAIDSVRPLIDERKHELTVSAGSGALRLEADPIRVEQILMNLLTNAAKYTESGGHIWVTAERRDSELMLRVRDDGIGISPEVLPTMFELFAQGERSIARSEGGLGIGLTIVRRLAEMHGGSVSAQSEGVGKGSVFTVLLPAVEVAPPVEAEPEPESKEGRGCSRILVIDDNVDTARGMTRLLKLLGHDVQAAYDGPTGMEAARSYRPDVILLDIGLPGMDGYEVARRLRREEFGKGVRIIAVSGYGQDEDRRRSKEAGFDHHLVKPIDHSALITLLTQPT